ncbi:MAG TPA: 3-oxoacyl-ACP reductase family protein [Chitinophagaceae bacterium]|jgi:3-oxoacyl-[acyl-carrier protein] reductase|nr:3-oxoacyl-ACP reductase family protein [Chitinophagaceae bacterium]
MRLKNKVAIVTGGARDIGKAISLKLAEEGAKIVINYFGSGEKANELVKQLTDKGAEAIAVKADVTKSNEVVQLIEASKKAFGSEVHILVNVAGGLIARKVLEDMDEAFWDQVIELNLKSVFLLSKYVVPFMPAGSSIINFSSQAARDGGGFGAMAYATSKGAVSTFTRGLAKELGPKGIRVNAVCPGMIATSFHDIFTKPEVRTNVANATPLRRQGEANEVADLVAYLTSDESSFITGANIDINGGMYFS